MSENYDFFVIGAGSGGVRAARIAALHGAKVGIAEKRDLGGTCVNRGCVPKKLLAYASDYGQHFEDASGFGWHADKTHFSWYDLIANKDNEIERLNSIYKGLLEKAGVNLFMAEATFKDSQTLILTDQSGNTEEITAERILVAVGGRPRRLDIEGGELAITSDDAFHLEEMPRDIAIIGGGYIGVEFAHIFRHLSCNVSLHYRGELFLKGFDDDIRLALAEEMRKQDIALHFHSQPERLEKMQDGRIRFISSSGDEEICDQVLAAVGRVPDTDHLKLDRAGIEKRTDGFIPVDKDFTTNVPNIYAIGDISSSYALTPVAIAEGHALADRLFSKRGRRHNMDCVPTAVFSHPPIGTAGKTEEDVIRENIVCDVYRTQFRPMRHTLTGRDEKTLIKVIVERATDKVLGCHMVGEDAPEIIQGMAVAMNAGATKADFDTTIAVHPTSAEEFVTLREPAYSLCTQTGECMTEDTE